MTPLLLSICFGLFESQKSSLESVANWKYASKALVLSPAHKRMLAKNSFFVSPGGDLTLFDLYGENDYRNLSSLVTVDSVVDLYHVFFDSTLRQVEEVHLLPATRRMSDALLRTATAQYNRLKGGTVESAALKNVAYFGVAERLTGGNAPIPDEAMPLVQDELQLIDGHAGFGSSAIFPYQLDYSQFIVRGHYRHDDALGRYFKAMMWYGLVPVSLTDRSGNPLPEQVRQAALMVAALNSGSTRTEWKRIYDVTSLYAGDANDLTPGEWTQATTPILGATPEAALASSVVIGRLVSAAKKAAHPEIVSKRTRGVNAAELQFRFMGQRAIPDSVVFNHLTGDERPFPSPLDIGAVFGSKQAAKILDSDPALYNPKKWAGYVPARQKDTVAWAAEPASFWDKNLYTGELDALRKIVAPAPSGAPSFMRAAAWQDRCLSSALGGWAELRHDTILYGEQTVAEMGDGGEPPPFVKGYVEPNLPVYQRLTWLVDHLKAGLAKYGYLSTRKVYGGSTTDAERFANFRNVLEFFSSVTKRELNGGKLSKAEHDRIRKIEGDLDDLWHTIQISNSNYQVLNQDDQDMAVVADVHTGGDQALEVAVGHADDLVAIVPIEGKRYLARGSVFSFYEFRVPISERMTDHDWKAFLEGGKDKPRPSWINSYFVNKPSRKPN